MVSNNAPGVSVGESYRTLLWSLPQSDLASERAPPGTVAMTTAQRLALVREYGDFSLAYTTAVQPGLQYFGDGRGYIAHDSRLGYTFALGDPVAAAPFRERLIQQFAAQNRRLAFCQISFATARILRDLGFYINEMGVDSVISLKDYDFRGQDKKWLRTATSWTSSRGYTIREETTERVSVDQINAVSSAWRATRVVNRNEVRFLNRPFAISDEADTRRFYFFDASGRLLAFVWFDPIHREGRLVGYVACSKRRHPDAPTYAEQAIMKHAIEVFQREGCQELRLGLSPLAWIEDDEFHSSWLIRKLFRTTFSSQLINRHFYNVRGHAEYKRRYRGREEKAYFATRSPWNLIQLAALIKTSKIV
jgi:lysylphosphatidylglycerol synthetase-like protein (DUF2156 family)